MIGSACVLDGYGERLSDLQSQHRIGDRYRF